MPSILRRRAAHQTVSCCLSSCRSSSLERSARGRRLIVVITDFPPSIKNSSFLTFIPSPDFFDHLTGIVVVVLVVMCRYLGHCKKSMFTMVGFAPELDHFTRELVFVGPDVQLSRDY